MSTRVLIKAAGVTVEAELLDTPCAKAVAEVLPIRAVPQEWGDEFYFSVPVDEELDDTAATKMKVGDIGYWPDVEEEYALELTESPSWHWREGGAESDLDD